MRLTMTAPAIITPDVDVLRALLARVEDASDADPMLDRDILSALHHQGHRISGAARPTGSLDAAMSLIGIALPGWAWSCGSCVVSNEAWVKPDIEGPDAAFATGSTRGFAATPSAETCPYPSCPLCLKG